MFWKPGITIVDRNRLTSDEWANWGSRAVWSFPSVRANDDHVAKFPLELPRRLIRLFTDPGDTILDCFMGSGTTAVAAITTGRPFIGIEKEAEYVMLANAACEYARAASLSEEDAQEITESALDSVQTSIQMKLLEHTQPYTASSRQTNDT